MSGRDGDPERAQKAIAGLAVGIVLYIARGMYIGTMQRERAHARLFRSNQERLATLPG